MVTKVTKNDIEWGEISEFGWSKKIAESIVRKVVRIDVALSKGLNGKLTWYRSYKYVAKEAFKKDEDIIQAWCGYQTAFNAFKSANKERVPIDYLNDIEKEELWFSFVPIGKTDDKTDVESIPPTYASFYAAQTALSNIVFKEAEHIKQILVFPNIGQKGFGSNCIVALSDIIVDDNEIYALMSECTKFSYKTSLREFSTILRKEAIKAAVAAIMSRNMSHNLGSHFLTNTKNFFAHQIKQLEQEKIGIADVKEDYRGNVAMLQYLQERMDFIATVVSGDKYPYGSLNFKSQLFDILTEDDHGARHGKKTQNFLLKYLVFSEKLTRGEGELENGFHKVKLKVEYFTKNNDESNSYIYTGEALKDEEMAKFMLSKLSLAVPGGLMARHAFFSIVENIIRNSAKHSKSDEDLELTIKLVERETDLDISISDNRYNTSAQQAIKDHYKELCVIDDDGSINKQSKGLKEILVCVLWLKNEDVADVLNEIQNIEENEKRLEKINEYLSIIDNGYSFTLPVYTPYYQLDNDRDYTLIGDRLKFTRNNQVLKTIRADIVGAEKDYELYVNGDGEGKDKKEDVHRHRKLSDIFPRFVLRQDTGVIDEELLLRKIHSSYFEKKIYINSTKFGDEPIKEKEAVVAAKVGQLGEKWDISFYDHFHNKPLDDKIRILEEAQKRYIESISGENYTSTIATKQFLMDPIARYKTVESALSRVVIIDERIYGDFKKRQEAVSRESIQEETIPEWWDDSLGFVDMYNEVKRRHGNLYGPNRTAIDKINTDRLGEMERKNKLKSLLFPPQKVKTEFGSLKDEDKKKAARIEQLTLEAKNIFLVDFNDNLDGFVDLSKEPASIKTEGDSKVFLSIHLGLIEKYKDIHKKKDQLLQESIGSCMKLIKDTFHPDFVAVHSGRGNFSADLSDSLSDYPFISLSALEAAFYNCKYFLSELFHNTNYYGKGNLNNEQTI